MFAPALPTTLLSPGASGLACTACDHLVERWQLPVLSGPHCPLCSAPLALVVPWDLDLDKVVEHDLAPFPPI